jgi:hypothetical protein
MDTGGRVVTGVCILLGVGLAILTIADYPPASYINSFQAWLFGGTYFPQLTMILLLAAGLLPILGIAAAVQALTRSAEDPQKAAIAAKLARKPSLLIPPGPAGASEEKPNEGIEKP